jgi:hypothetical protein
MYNFSLLGLWLMIKTQGKRCFKGKKNREAEKNQHRSSGKSFPEFCEAKLPSSTRKAR